jgi:multicomponent Na+:H+ antiporter subunit E
MAVVHLALTLVWAGLLGAFDLATLASGFFLSYGFLWLIFRGAEGNRAYFSKPPKVLAFLAYYLKEMVVSNLIIARDIVTPTHYMRPGVVAIPLRARTDFEITLLANLITMTPGTLSLDISADRKTLFVHAMYIDNPESLRAEITGNLERRVLEILR